MGKLVMSKLEHIFHRKLYFFKKICTLKTRKGCLLWQGGTDTFGYGRYLGMDGKYIAAHRLSYELCYGKIKKALHVLHKCDIPRCVNPEHLFVGTRSDNMKDMYQKKRHKKFDKLTPCQVKAIKKQLAKGFTCYYLTKKYNVYSGLINKIKNGKELF